jgi:hypothetical protein
MDVSARCDTRYTAKHNSGKRPLSAVKLIVMHDTEGGTAESIARYFASPNSGGSAHLVVDDTACYRCLGNDVIPWAAPGANTQGFHIEQCGYAKWTTLWMSKHRATLERAAYKAALHCRLFGIPPYFIGASELKAGRPGVTTHAECTKAFGGDHTDPGFGWPRYWFMRRVRYHHRRLGHVEQVG